MMAADKDTPSAEQGNGVQEEWEDDSWGPWRGDAAQGQWVWTSNAAATAAAKAAATTTAAAAAAQAAAVQAQAAAVQAQTAASIAQNSVGQCWNYVEQAGEAATETVSSQPSSSSSSAAFSPCHKCKKNCFVHTGICVNPICVRNPVKSMVDKLEATETNMQQQIEQLLDKQDKLEADIQVMMRRHVAHEQATLQQVELTHHQCMLTCLHGMSDRLLQFPPSTASNPNGTAMPSVPRAHGPAVTLPAGMMPRSKATTGPPVQAAIQVKAAPQTGDRPKTPPSQKPAKAAPLAAHNPAKAAPLAAHSPPAPPTRPAPAAPAHSSPASSSAATSCYVIEPEGPQPPPWQKPSSDDDVDDVEL